MATPLTSFRVTEVRRPRIDATVPAGVTAEATFSISEMRPAIAAEWDELKQHDVVFLLTLRPP